MGMLKQPGKFAVHHPVGVCRSQSLDACLRYRTCLVLPSSLYVGVNPVHVTSNPALTRM